jgi:hypothetical protein
VLLSIQNDVAANFISINIDKFTVIDNTSWISLHLFFVQGWKQIPLLVCVEKVGM